MEPLCLSPRPCVSSLLYLFHSFSLPHKHHCDRLESMQLLEANKFVMEMAGEQLETTGQKKKLERSVPFSICLYVYLCDLFISPSHRRLPGEPEGLDICLWCVQVCVCI